MALKIQLPEDRVPPKLAGVIDGIVPVHFADENGAWMLKIGDGEKAWTHRGPRGKRRRAEVRSFLYQAVANYRAAMRDFTQSAFPA